MKPIFHTYDETNMIRMRRPIVLKVEETKSHKYEETKPPNNDESNSPNKRGQTVLYMRRPTLLNMRRPTLLDIMKTNVVACFTKKNMRRPIILKVEEPKLHKYEETNSLNICFELLLTFIPKRAPPDPIAGTGGSAAGNRRRAWLYPCALPRPSRPWLG
jgi:hypothetical protein